MEEPPLAAAAASGAEEGNEFNLGTAFYDAYKAYVERVRNAEERVPKEVLQDLQLQLRRIAAHVEALSLFSPNEELAEVSTMSLKYLLVPFLLAEVAAADMDMAARLASMKSAMIYWKTFCGHCERLGTVHPADLELLRRDDDHALTADDRRTEKIARFKRGKELDDKVNYMFKRRRLFGDEYEWGVMDEDIERDLILSLLQRSVIAAIENMDSGRQELQMLEIMEARGGPGAPPPKKPDKKPPQPWVLRLNDRSALEEFYRQQVFQPDIPMPTMTLAEFAEQEKEEMLKREEEQRRREFQKACEEREKYDGNTYAQERDAEEAKYYKDRDWDDWKDDHPKGSGNKMAKIG